MNTVEKNEKDVTVMEEVGFVIEPILDGTIRAANLTYTAEEEEAMLLRFQEAGGVPEPFSVWKENHKLLWNYRAFEIAVEHGFHYETVEKSFATMADALAFVADIKLAIPTITLFEKVLTARQFGEYWQVKYDREHPVCVAAAQKNNGVLDALGIAGVKAGVCRSTVNKVNRIMDSKKEDLIEKCRKGELSISTVYDLINGPAEDENGSDKSQGEVKDEEALAAEQKRHVRSKYNELNSLAKYSVKGFSGGEKLSKAGLKFFVLRWNDEHSDNQIQEEEVPEAIKNFKKENKKKGKK